MSTRLRTIDDLMRFLNTVPVMLIYERRKRQLSIRAAADEIGISPTGLSQIEHGHNYNVGSLKKILEWLNGDSASEHRGARGGAADPAFDFDPDHRSDRPADGGQPGGPTGGVDPDRPAEMAGQESR